jgi:glycosyltransferase involved in cell wall biosynthesis
MKSNKSTKKKICIVAPVHIYNDIRVFQKQAISLATHNYDVVLFARCTEDKIEHGIHIRALSTYTRKKRFLTLPYLLYQLIQVNADVYHLHNPDTLPLGYFLKMLGKKVIYDTHENFKELILYKTWIPKLLRKPLAHIVYVGERLASFLFNAMIVTQKRQRNIYGKNCLIIENAPIVQSDLLENVKKYSKTISLEPNTLRLIYPGLITRERGALTLLKLLEVMNEKQKVRLWLLGPFGDPTLLEEMKQRSGWHYVDYLGHCDALTTFAHIQKADLGLILFHPVADNMFISPNKLFEYMAFSTPFVASDFPTWRSYLNNTNVGIWTNPLNVQEVCCKILNATKDPKKLADFAERGYQFVKQEYNWDIEKEKLLNLYQTLLDN